jgi:hypothetical protein
MTLGRPCSIPESYVKLDMPLCLSTVTSVNFETGLLKDVPADSLAFYNATMQVLPQLLVMMGITVIDAMVPGVPKKGRLM